MSRSITHRDFHTITGSFRIPIAGRWLRLSSIVFAVCCLALCFLVWMVSASRSHAERGDCAFGGCGPALPGREAR